MLTSVANHPLKFQVNCPFIPKLVFLHPYSMLIISTQMVAMVNTILEDESCLTATRAAALVPGQICIAR